MQAEDFSNIDWAGCPELHEAEHMFSRVATRLHGDTNPLYKAREALLRQGHRITDLVSGNVNEHGLSFPQVLLEEILVGASRRCEVYRPESLGQVPARTAICDYYRARGVSIAPQDILLTPGTSISYWYCFKLLADEGEEVLCPRPTYPLFDYIAEMSGVRLIYYPLDEASGWAIDFERLENRISTGTRAVVLISPHNPTGRVAPAGEIDRLAEVARRHQLALVADEVFSEFLLRQEPLPRVAGSGAPLVFTLNGFSKMFALPGLKFGWIAVSGDRALVSEAMRSLELISDTFLPVSEIVQAAAPEIFCRGAPFLQVYADEIRARWQAAEEALRTLPGSRFVQPEGGFYVTLQLEGIEEEKAAGALLTDHQLLVHPGYFYDMEPHHLVFSFVHGREKMREFLPKMASTLGMLSTG